MNTFWDERYGSEEYAYGIHPNEFFRQKLKNIKGKKILFPAEGEGRNAVYAAVQGYDVVAFDPSTEGKKKALLLAEKNKVSIEYQISGYDNIQFPEAYFDAIVLIFAHMPPEKRTEWHQKLSKYLKPGGYIILEGFSKEQLKYGTGGPPVLEMLFSKDELLNDFKGMNVLSLEQEIAVLEEGKFHRGKAAVIHGVFEKMPNFEE